MPGKGLDKRRHSIIATSQSNLGNRLALLQQRQSTENTHTLTPQPETQSGLQAANVTEYCTANPQLQRPVSQTTVAVRLLLLVQGNLQRALVLRQGQHRATGFGQLQL